MFRTLTTLPVSVLTLIFATPAFAENVEILLNDRLDNTQNGYCIDIARAQGADANPNDGLQGHTCYSSTGKLAVDQVFDSSKFAEGILYMPEFDVCVEVPSIEAGTAIGLAPCDGSREQSVHFSGNGTIGPVAAPETCFTLAEGTRTGRSDANQIKALSLEVCSRAKVEYQTWEVRSLEGLQTAE